MNKMGIGNKKGTAAGAVLEKAKNEKAGKFWMFYLIHNNSI